MNSERIAVIFMALVVWAMSLVLAYKIGAEAAPRPLTIPVTFSMTPSYEIESARTYLGSGSTIEILDAKQIKPSPLPADGKEKK